MFTSDPTREGALLIDCLFTGVSIALALAITSGWAAFLLSLIINLCMVLLSGTVLRPQYQAAAAVVGREAQALGATVRGWFK